MRSNIARGWLIELAFLSGCPSLGEEKQEPKFFVFDRQELITVQTASAFNHALVLRQFDNFAHALQCVIYRHLNDRVALLDH